MASPESPTSAQAPAVSVSTVRAAAGTGTFDIDWIGLFPADEDAGILEVTQAGSGVLALDGWDHRPRLYTTDPYLGVSPAAVGAPGLSWVGGVPRLRPGDNRLYLVAGLGTAASSSRAPGFTFTVSGSYWPRFGWLA
jgi:hypothetical protein